jgi:hypothetical protein
MLRLSAGNTQTENPEELTLELLEGDKKNLIWTSKADWQTGKPIAISFTDHAIGGEAALLNPDESIRYAQILLNSKLAVITDHNYVFSFPEAMSAIPYGYQGSH